jgi:hypothetical protein
MLSVFEEWDLMELVKSARRPSREAGTRWRHLLTLIVAALAAMLFIPSAASAAGLGSGATATSRLAQTQFSTFGTISAGGAIVDRFGVVSTLTR